jgi:hypothetical protein
MTTIVPSAARRARRRAAAVLVRRAPSAAGSSDRRRLDAGAKAAGGTITVLSAGDVDHIDPGQAYYSFSYEITYATQRPLLAYRPNSVTRCPTSPRRCRRSRRTARP